MDPTGRRRRLFRFLSEKSAMRVGIALGVLACVLLASYFGLNYMGRRMAEVLRQAHEEMVYDLSRVGAGLKTGEVGEPIESPAPKAQEVKPSAPADQAPATVAPPQSRMGKESGTGAKEGMTVPGKPSPSAGAVAVGGQAPAPKPDTVGSDAVGGKAEAASTAQDKVASASKSATPAVGAGEQYRQNLDKLASILRGKKIVAGFGWCFSEVHKDWRYHPGVDVAAEPDETVKAILDGVVVEVGGDPRLGNFVSLDHGSGLRTIYGALSQIAVKAGDRLTAGQVIGSIGKPGMRDVSLGPCLHLELRKDGVPIDPCR